MYLQLCHYLYKEDNEEIEVGYPPELLKEILGDEIPNCVLREKTKAAKCYSSWISACLKKPTLYFLHLFEFHNIINITQKKCLSFDWVDPVLSTNRSSPLPSFSPHQSS